jgi:hypothetical protein
MPRCCPASYSLGATTKGRSTAPDAGQVHADAVGDTASVAVSRISPVVASRENMATSVAGGSAVVKTVYREPL